jgi:hypothetical protein
MYYRPNESYKRTGLDGSVNHHGWRRRVELERLWAKGVWLFHYNETLDKRGREHNNHQAPHEAGLLVVHALLWPCAENYER